MRKVFLDAIFLTYFFSGLIPLTTNTAPDPRTYGYEYDCGQADTGRRVCACYYIDGGREIFADCSGRAMLRYIPEFTAIEMDRLSTIAMTSTPYCADRPLIRRQMLHDVRILCDPGVEEAPTTRPPELSRLSRPPSGLFFEDSDSVEDGNALGIAGLSIGVIALVAVIATCTTLLVFFRRVSS
jgi:hypothetical protein